MPFPSPLVPLTERGGTKLSTIVCQATGVPDPGNNVVGLPWVGQGVDPSLIELDWIDFRCEAQGPSVLGAAPVSLSPDKTSVTINFSQTGGDAALLRATLKHTIVS
jgi:hypothetical protein